MATKVKDIMAKDVATLNLNEELSLAEDIMKLGRIRHLTAMGEGRPIPVLTGECPAMDKAAFGKLEILSDFSHAQNYLERLDRDAAKILVTAEIDWSWTRILEHFVGVITDQGTRVSRAAEVLTLMDKPGVLGTKKATEILHSGARAEIVCHGNEALVYLVHEEKPRA